MVLALQVFLAVWGVADQWTRGHNGWNGAAYHNAARNTLRWDVLFPLQYETANVPPRRSSSTRTRRSPCTYTTSPACKLFGDREVSIRLVAGFWSIAALCMLFAVVQRLWGDGHALTASAVYVALPINAIYINMANHSAGFIFWALLSLLPVLASTARGAADLDALHPLPLRLHGRGHLGLARVLHRCVHCSCTGLGAQLRSSAVDTEAGRSRDSARIVLRLGPAAVRGALRPGGRV